MKSGFHRRMQFRGDRFQAHRNAQGPALRIKTIDPVQIPLAGISGFAIVRSELLRNPQFWIFLQQLFPPLPKDGLSGDRLNTMVDGSLRDEGRLRAIMWCRTIHSGDGRTGVSARLPHIESDQPESCGCAGLCPAASIAHGHRNGAEVVG